MRTLADLKVLIVDDLPSMCRILKQQLARLNVEQLFEANSIESALSVTGTEELSLIITDLHLGDESAESLITKLRSDGIDIPIIVVTSDMDRNVFEHFQSLGVFSYLLKPFSSVDLEDQLEKLLEQSASK